MIDADAVDLLAFGNELHLYATGDPGGMVHHARIASAGGEATFVRLAAETLTNAFEAGGLSGLTIHDHRE
jgi:hypothetical protein